MGDLVLGTHHKAMILVPLSIMSWLIATFMTRPVTADKLRSFYAKVQPGGHWGVYKPRLETHKTGLAWQVVLPWFSGVLMTFGLTFGIGKLVLQQYMPAVVLLLLAVVGGLGVAKELMRKDD